MSHNNWKSLTRRKTNRPGLALTRTEKIQTKAIAKKVVREAEEEKYNLIKHNVVTPVSDPTVPGTFIYCLNGMLRGVAGGNERIGNEVMNRSINIKITAKAQTTESWLRVIIFRDPITDLNAPVLSEILTNLTAVTFADAYTAQRNHNFFKKGVYKLYYDKTFSMKVGGGSTNIAEPIAITINKRLNFKTHYATSNNGDVTDIVKNGLFMLLVSNKQQASIAEAPATSFHSKLLFTDA